MNNQIINAKQLKYVIALFYIGSSLVAGGTTEKAQQDSWISIIIATVMIVPIILLYCAILKLYPGNNLFDIIINIFGNIAGKILCAVYVFYAIHLGALVTNISSSFIQIVNMPETPDIVIAWFILFPCIYLVYKGAKVLGNIANFIFPILTVSVLFTVLASIKIMNFNYLFPIMSTDFSDLMDSSFNVLSLPLGEIVLPLALFSFDSNVKNSKILFQGIVLGMGIILIANLRNLLVLGPDVIKLFPFSSYISVSIIAIGEFLTRAEVLIGINLLIGGFFKIALCSIVASIGLAKIFNVNEYKQFAVPVSFLMIALKSNMFPNSYEALKIIYIYKYYAAPYQFFLPLIIFIAGAIKILYTKIKMIKKPDINQNI